MTEFDPTTKITRRSRVDNSPNRAVPAHLQPSQSPETLDRVTLSHKPQASVPETNKTRASGEIRHQLVGKFRDILENGTYKIKADEIADKMVQKIREQKNRMII